MYAQLITLHRGILERCSANGLRESPVACEGAQRCEDVPDTDPPIAQCVSTCGDGQVQEPEECDDGNTVNDDGCSNDCRVSRCGDGIEQFGEECDDGNTATETCEYGLMTCQVCNEECRLVSGDVAFCGDEVINDANGETCDDGSANAYRAACTDMCEGPLAAMAFNVRILPDRPRLILNTAMTAIRPSLMVAMRAANTRRGTTH